MSTQPTVSIISPGAMGASIGALLTANGLKVRTLLDGRSDKTKARARTAGMEAATMETIAECDFLLSIVPPSEAIAVAEQLIAGGAFNNHKPVFVDCNAIAPRLAVEIGALITEAGCAFVDGGIVGGAAKPSGERAPLFYLSGESASKLEALSEYGLNTHDLSAPAGAASALKMALAGVAKGMTGLAVMMSLVAEDSGVRAAFERQLEVSQPAFYSWAQKRLPTVDQKAYRWVDEMRTLSDIAGDLPGGGDLFAGLADLYEWIGKSDDDAKAAINIFANAFRPD